MLRITDLSKRYKTGDDALKSVSLEVPDGQVLGLIGPSGAGKSTLIRCVNRLVEPTSGSVDLNGARLERMGSGKLRKARRRIGMIFQEYALVERLSVMENVLSGRLGYVGFWASWFRKYPKKDIDEAFRLLERVGLDHMVNKRADASRQIMRLICELCEERNLSAIINIHDVALAKLYLQRIVGLQAGEVVFDGAASSLDSSVLTKIYGEEDWEAA